MYESIDEMPIYNWFKCVELKDYSYCAKDKNKSDLEACQIRFSELYAEYIDTFGISQQLNDILSLQNEILVLKIDLTLTKDNGIKTFIELKELELADKLNIKQSKTNTAKVAIEKYLGFRINEKEVTVKEYYDYLQAIKEDNGRSTD
jgi:hypothetical protein